MFSRATFLLSRSRFACLRNISNMLKSRLDTSSSTFIDNHRRMQGLVEDLQMKTCVAVCGGGEKNKARKKHVQRGKLLVRDRINLLLDKNTAFLELTGLCGHGMYDGTIHSGGIVTGVGRIHGRLCMIIANDATIKGGTYFSVTIKKHVRAQEIAEQCNLPCIHLADSGGANILSSAEVFPDRDHVGRIFYNVANMSGQGIMQIAVVMGSCTAGGALPPVLSDETVIVTKTGTVHVAGPPLVKAATGEDVTSEELGGATVACASGGMDHFAVNEEHAISIVRQMINNHTQKAPETFGEAYEPPLYDSNELYGIVHEDVMKPFDMREVIARVFDGSKFDEFKKNFNDTLLCGWAKLYGKTVGVIGNNGVLFAESAMKATHFIQLCVQRDTPIIFLQNITGFLVGLQSEANGIAKHAAKFVTSVACAKVPKLTVIVRGSFGAGSGAMCHKSFDPRFLYMWPCGQYSIMGGQQAADVLAEVASMGKEWTDEEKANYKKKVFDQYTLEGSPYYNTARVWNDGVIDPKDTRKILGLSLSVALNGKKQETKWGTLRM